MATVGDRVPIGTRCPTCENEELRAKVERLKDAYTVSQTNLIGMELQVSETERKASELCQKTGELMMLIHDVIRAARGTGDYIGQDGQLIKRLKAAVTPVPEKPECRCSFSGNADLIGGCPVHAEKRVDEKLCNHSYTLDGGRCASCGEMTLKR